MKKTRIIFVSILTLLLLAAIGVILYPLISNAVNEKYQSVVQTEYEEQIAAADDTEILTARKKADEYNAALLPVQFSVEGIQKAATEYDNLLNMTGNGIMGYVDIPKLDVYLPIFHGVDESALENGVGHLVGSSLPVGGAGTHTVLSGHSGMAGKRLFSDIDQLVTGDVIYLHVLDEVLAYEVTEQHTVLPEDTTYLAIHPDKDRCTLITCTPFGVNTHRLLVQCDRIPYEQAPEKEAEAVRDDPPVKSTWKEQYYRGLLIGGAILAFFALLTGAALFLRCIIKHRRAKHDKT